MRAVRWLVCHSWTTAETNRASGQQPWFCVLLKFDGWTRFDTGHLCFWPDCKCKICKAFPKNEWWNVVRSSLGLRLRPNGSTNSLRLSLRRGWLAGLKLYCKQMKRTSNPNKWHENGRKKRNFNYFVHWSIWIPLRLLTAVATRGARAGVSAARSLGALVLVGSIATVESCFRMNENWKLIEWW